jgi:hypothetical protein
VELDRAWRALDATLISATQRSEFDALLAHLTVLTRERGDHTLKIERWTAEARHALLHLHAACIAAAEGSKDRIHLASADASARAVVEAAPEGDAGSSLRDSLLGALQTCAQLDERLVVLDELLQAPSATRPATTTEVSAGDAVPEAAAPRHDPALRWHQLSPLADPRLADALNHRFEQWHQARHHAQQARRAQRREQAQDRKQGIQNERTETLTTVLELAEAALAAGHLADTNKHLIEVDDLLNSGASAGALQARIQALQGEYARLKGWQHWGGGLARDELVLQAEALAAATLGEADTRIVKLSTKQQAELINDLRSRWKELDRLGGASSRSLWQRFDTALKAAYEPVAAQLDVQRAARAQNLQGRNQLIEALNAIALPDVNEDGSAPDWKAQAVALDHFQTEWRKLGPLEHTVPHKERDPLIERMGAAVSRIEAPLNEARRGAQLARERLVTRAKALASEAQGRDLVGKVRELQTEWQQMARAMPLARATENALWAEFKSDIDALFSARDAASSARDAEFKAHGAERAALIERLAAMGPDTPSAELKRTLADVEAQWQRTGPAPRNDAAALDSEFIKARDTVRQLLAGYAQRGWHATCDALVTKLALCEAMEREGRTAESKATIEQRWAGLPVLPVAWEQTLARRASLIGAAQGGSSPITASTDDLLLQLEAALQLDSPSEFQAARRELKLRAMKAALEGRQSVASTALAPDQLLAAALGRTALDDVQRERLARVIAAVRERADAPYS